MASTTKSTTKAETGRVETMDYAAMMIRMMRAWERRLADADEPDLAELAAFPQLVALTQDRVVAAWRERGRSWSEIARPFGISRQAAQQRWGHEPAPYLASASEA